MLTLPSSIMVDATLPITLGTGGYTVARYGAQGSGFVSALSTLNSQLAPYNLYFDTTNIATSLVLKRTSTLPPGVSSSNVMVTFQAPAYYNINATRGGGLTDFGEGLFVECQPTPSGSIIRIPLYNHKVETFSADGTASDPNPGTTNFDANYWTWMGSWPLPIGTYSWNLYKGNYGQTTAVSGILASGSLNLTSETAANPTIGVTYQITPGQMS